MLRAIYNLDVVFKEIKEKAISFMLESRTFLKNALVAGKQIQAAIHLFWLYIKINQFSKYIQFVF